MPANFPISNKFRQTKNSFLAAITGYPPAASSRGGWGAMSRIKKTEIQQITDSSRLPEVRRLRRIFKFSRMFFVTRRYPLLCSLPRPQSPHPRVPSSS